MMHLFLTTLCGTSLLLAAEALPVGRFSQGDLRGWEPETFAGETRYRLEPQDGKMVLRADSDNSASGLVRRIPVDLRQTPILHWSWRVDKLITGNDERQRSGDDYPARIYVVFSGGLLFWRTRAINYVWSSHQPIGSSWPNAYTGNARMIAVDSGQANLGQWVAHHRNVLEDFRRMFGDVPETADAVAIMTDTDNTDQRVTSWYGDIWFAAE